VRILWRGARSSKRRRQVGRLTRANSPSDGDLTALFAPFTRATKTSIFWADYLNWMAFTRVNIRDSMLLSFMPQID
jgi:hypothetical protein